MPPVRRVRLLPISGRLPSSPCHPRDRDTYHRFDAKKHWVTKHNMKLHPYQKEVPYMQAYNHVSLDSGRNMALLLTRLSGGAPTFYDYGTNPPSTVLDLGCGPGYWVQQAAASWPNSQITGFDLVDILSTSCMLPSNVKFVQGDFLNFALPFEAFTFELVRMSDLSLCIPHDKWDFLLREVQRVLTVGGRLELIDDEIFFPYGDKCALSTVRKQRDHGLSSQNGSRVLSFRDTEGNTYPVLCCTSILNYKPESFKSQTEETTTRQLVCASKTLEMVFERMLLERYKVHVRPGDFLLGFLQSTFGQPGSSCKAYKIKLPKSSGMFLSSLPSKVSFVDVADRLGRELGPPCHPDVIRGQGSSRFQRIGSKWFFSILKRKHIVRLITKLYTSRKHLSRRPTYTPTATRALLVAPGTYLALSVGEVEMHACKYIHTLLGCRAALKDFVQHFRGEDGEVLVNDQEFDEELWQYECFRRARLDLPDEILDLGSTTKAHLSTTLVSRTPIKIRRIKVYQAVKRS